HGALGQARRGVRSWCRPGARDRSACGPRAVRASRDRGETEPGPGLVDRHDLEVDKSVRKAGSAHGALGDVGTDTRGPFRPTDPKGVLVGTFCHVSDTGG